MIAWKRPGLMGPRPTMFTVLPTWMGSDTVPGLSDRAKAAVSEYDRLVSKVGMIANDKARAELVDGLGSWNSPGSPAERYAVVVADLKDTQPDPVLQAKRIGELESAILEFRPKVDQAEAAYGLTTSADTGQVATSDGVFTPKGVALVAVAVVSVFILPFVLD